MQPDSTYWRIPNNRQLYVQSWQGGSVLFEACSGDTLHIGELAAELIRYLSQREPVTLPELVDYVASLLPDTTLSELGAKVEQHLVELQKLQLVESAP